MPFETKVSVLRGGGRGDAGRWVKAVVTDDGSHAAYHSWQTGADGIKRRVAVVLAHPDFGLSAADLARVRAGGATY